MPYLAEVAIHGSRTFPGWIRERPLLYLLVISGVSDQSDRPWLSRTLET
jgi:hypothetical protein